MTTKLVMKVHSSWTLK